MFFVMKSNASDEIRSYIQLQQKIHDDLRVQHPEWVEPNGDCPTCESYESRLAELLGLSSRTQLRRNTPRHSDYGGAAGSNFAGSPPRIPSARKMKQMIEGATRQRFRS